MEIMTQVDGNHRHLQPISLQNIKLIEIQKIVLELLQWPEKE